MPARVAFVSNPSSGAFPRWGYLDKYAVNEYMARSLALTVALVFVLGGLLQWLQSRAPVPIPCPVPGARPSYSEPVVIGPPPSVIQRVKVVAETGGSATIRPRFFTPVPVPGLDTDAAPSGSGPGAGPPVDGAYEPANEPLRVDVVPGDMPAWPSPDDVIVVEKEPLLIAMQPPVYPEIAREAGIEGTVLMRVLVDTQGAVRDEQVLQSIRGLDEAALAAATTAVFRPALQQDKPVAVWVVVPIEFRLRD
jgi:periplasmic protein TonB